MSVQLELNVWTLSHLYRFLVHLYSLVSNPFINPTLELKSRQHDFYLSLFLYPQFPHKLSLSIWFPLLRVPSTGCNFLPVFFSSVSSMWVFTGFVTSLFYPHLSFCNVFPSLQDCRLRGLLSSRKTFMGDGHRYSSSNHHNCLIRSILYGIR